MTKPIGYPSDRALESARLLVNEWDSDNAMCLLGDHREDLIFRIAKFHSVSKPEICDVLQMVVDTHYNYIWRSRELLEQMRGTA